MDTIITEQGGGKTTEIIKLANKRGLYIVCQNPDDVAAFAQRLKLDIHYPLTFDEYLDGRFNNRSIKEVIIDNADNLLEYVARKLGTKISAISITNEDYEVDTVM